MSSVLPLTLSTAVSLSAVTLMFALPGEAAPAPSTFSADVSGEVWRVNRLDLDMSGDPVQVDVGVARAQGLLASAASPDRARAVAQNLSAAPAPTGLAKAESVATQTQDTTGTRTVVGTAGQVASVLDYKPSTLTARGRWGGDASCLDATAPLTASGSVSQGSGIVPAPIPAGTPPLLPFPTTAPSELPTTLPTTEVTATLMPRSAADSAVPTAAAGDVSMAKVAAASVEEVTQLQAITGSTTLRRVYAETVGRVTAPSAPVATFLGGEAELRMTGTPKLSAYSDGGPGGSQVTWTPPTAMTLTVAGEAFAVPADGTALELPYSQNEDVVLTVSAGRLEATESPQGVLAQAAVSVLHILIRNGDSVVLDADLFPMSVKAVAPQGGVDCTPAESSQLSSPSMTLKGRDNGARADVLRVRAATEAAGARSTVFRIVDGERRKVAAGRLDAAGDRAFLLRDRNGRKATTYVVRVHRTERTMPGTASRKLR